MAGSARERGIALRPHAKTHKSPDIARRQLRHGAPGLTVATVADAGVFAAAGCADLFVGYPLWVDAAVLVEVDSGQHRTGVLPEAAGAVRVGLLAEHHAVLDWEAAGCFPPRVHGGQPRRGLGHQRRRLLARDRPRRQHLTPSSRRI